MKNEKPFVLSFEEAIGLSKRELGGKGYGLMEMTKLGLPVPPGLIIPTYVCREYYRAGRLPKQLMDMVADKLKMIEDKVGRKLGSVHKPLLVSVRSGAPVSMPGMMDTILNLGLNDEIVEALAKETGNMSFAYDTYFRFVHCFSRIVLRVPQEELDEAVEEFLRSRSFRVLDFSKLSHEDLKELIWDLKKVVGHKTGRRFPEDPKDQLKEAIEAVFRSWNNPRAKAYRKLYKIPEDLCTAVVIQAMVFGNLGQNSGTGVCFTRNPSTGEKELYGEFLINAQGEDIVAGERTPMPIHELRRRFPRIYEQLLNIAEILEKHFKDMQDIEFTIQEGKLYILQTRPGKRTLKASIKIAVDMVEEGLITEREAIERVDMSKLAQVFKSRIDPHAGIKPLARGLNASPGIATGKVVFTVRDAEVYSSKGEPVILVRPETKPEDVRGIAVSVGILTTKGGMTSHAAVVARGLGKPAVVGAKDVKIDLDNELFKVNNLVVRKFAVITIDGSTGNIYLGKVPTIKPEIPPEIRKLLNWAEKYGKHVPSELKNLI